MLACVGLVCPVRAKHPLTVLRTALATCNCCPIEGPDPVCHHIHALNCCMPLWSGLPEEVRITQQALQAGYAVVALSSKMRQQPFCWDTSWPPQPNSDLPRVKPSPSHVMNCVLWHIVIHHILISLVHDAKHACTMFNQSVIHAKCSCSWGVTSSGLSCNTDPHSSLSPSCFSSHPHCILSPMLPQHGAACISGLEHFASITAWCSVCNTCLFATA